MKFMAKVALGLGMAVAALAVPTSALAAGNEEPSECPAGHVCFYSKPNYTGEMKIYKNPVSHDCGTTEIQPARSVKNNDDQTWMFYLDTDGCEGPGWEIEPGKGQPNTLVYNWK